MSCDLNDLLVLTRLSLLWSRYQQHPMQIYLIQELISYYVKGSIKNICTLSSSDAKWYEHTATAPKIEARQY